MPISIAHLGPTGTNAETAALAYANWLSKERGQPSILYPCSSIAQTLQAVALGQTEQAVVPVENSTEGSIAVTLDLLWEFDRLTIEQELVLPINHVLLSHASDLPSIKTVYSHPQALAQCQKWLEKYLPLVQLIPANATTEALHQIKAETTAAVIASPRAAKLYQIPILAHDIQDYPDNCTRFWVLGSTPSLTGTRVSLAFSVPENVPGAIVKPLEVFAQRNINMTRIESRPTKRSLGEYLFYIDLSGGIQETAIQEALAELETHTKVLKIFGSYPVTLLKLADIE